MFQNELSINQGLPVINRYRSEAVFEEVLTTRRRAIAIFIFVSVFVGALTNPILK